MKRLFSFLLLLPAVTLFSQGIYNEVGIEGGVNTTYPINSKEYSWPSKYEFRVGFAIGLNNTINFTRHSALYLGALYEQKNTFANVWIPWYMYSYDEEITTHSVILPMLYRYTFCSTSKIKVFANVGPSMSVGFRSKVTQYPSMFRPVLTTQTTTNSWFDLNMAVGAGVKIGINSRLSITTEMRQLFWLLSRSEKNTYTVKDNGLNFGTSYILTGLTYRLGK